MHYFKDINLLAIIIENKDFENDVIEELISDNNYIHNHSTL